MVGVSSFCKLHNAALTLHQNCTKITLVTWISPCWQPPNWSRSIHFRHS